MRRAKPPGRNRFDAHASLAQNIHPEPGIPSGCEFDVNGIVSMKALMAVSGKCPFLGNTEPLA